MNSKIGFLLNKSFEYLKDSNWDTAELYLNQALKIQSNNPHTLGLLAIVYAKREQYEEALEFTNRSLKLLPKNALILSNLGNIYLGLKEFKKALDAYDRSLLIDQNNPEAWLNGGNVLQELKRFEEALAHYDKVLSLQPNSPEAWSNKGNALLELKRFEEALTHYDTALNVKPNYAEAWSNKGNALHELKQFEEAIAHYDKSISFNPGYSNAYANKGNALNELKRFQAALEAYDEALKLNPNYAEVYSCKGNTLYELKRFDEAIAHHDRALSLNPGKAESWLNKGVTLIALNRLHDAITCYTQALSLEPDFNWIEGYLIHLRMKIADWSELQKSMLSISKKIMANQKVIRPFELLSLLDDPALHKKAGNMVIEDQVQSNPNLGLIPKHEKKEKVRIAYFSPDFRNHPVSALTAELFEIHDRSKFEVIAFSLQKAPIGDEMNIRLKKGFDEFLEVENLSDREIASLARHKKIDIAIDLAGHTQNSRTAIFSYRAAPIQLSYIGYLGTMGANYYDYLLADRITIPEDMQKFYSEKIAYIPSYQANDRARSISYKKFTRAELGLPEAAFIFCCFNSNYKILPAIFDSWMRILKAVEGGVIFLYAENQWAEKNLKKEAEARGINSERLIFGGHMPNDKYLSRYQACDLFLDTYPYNAGTTASDALWAGLPVLTLMGQSFASRVAASLLNAIGLPDLITNSQEEYETLAIELAKSPNKLAEIKKRLAENRLTTPLFDTPLFTKNLEAAYIKMCKLYQKDLKPDHISIDFEPG